MEMDSMAAAEAPTPTSTCGLRPAQVLLSSPLREGITMLLSQWTGLQIAVENQWGGPDSFKKSQQLVFDVLSWFSQPQASLCVEELESLLHESMLFSFDTEIEDGSIEEVAEQLMLLHEEYLHTSPCNCEIPKM